MAGVHAVGFALSRCEGMAQGPSRGQGVAGLVPGFPSHLGLFRARLAPCFPRIPNVAACLMVIRPGPHHKGSHITRPEGEGVHTLMVPGCRPEPAIGRCPVGAGHDGKGPGMTGSRFAEILRCAQDDKGAQNLIGSLAVKWLKVSEMLKIICSKWSRKHSGSS